MQDQQGLTESKEPSAGSVSESRRRSPLLLPRAITGLSLLPYLLAIVFVAAPFLANSPLFSSLPGQDTILEIAATIPLMLVGYAFGVLGGITRTASEHGYFFLMRSGDDRISGTFVSGVLGMMTYLALDSGFVLKMIYPEITIPTEAAVGFRGVAISAFLVGFFSGETILLGREKLRSALRNEAERRKMEE